MGRFKLSKFNFSFLHHVMRPKKVACDKKNMETGVTGQFPEWLFVH
jgi:hypothetical protein